MNPKRSKFFIATILSTGLLLSAIATPTTAGIVPWAWNLLFGPSCAGSTCGGCQLTSCGSCFQPSPTYNAPVYSVPTYSAPVYSQPAPVYSVPTYSEPVYSAPVYSTPSYSVPSSSCPSCTTPTFSEPIYGPTSEIYNGGIYDGGVVYGGDIPGETIVSGGIVGGEITSGYAPYGETYGETIFSGPISDGSYIDNSYTTNSYIQPSCSSCTSGCGITYPDDGTIISGPVIDNTVPSAPASSIGSADNQMDNSISTDTLDAEGTPEPDEEPLGDVDEGGLGDFMNRPPRRNRGGDLEPGDFVDPVEEVENFKPADMGADPDADDPDAESGFGSPDDGDMESGFGSPDDGDMESGFGSPDDGDMESGFGSPDTEDIDSPNDLEDEFNRSSTETGSAPVARFEAKPIESELPAIVTSTRMVRTMTSRQSSPSANSVVLNAPKQTPVRWISAPRITRVR